MFPSKKRKKEKENTRKPKEEQEKGKKKYQFYGKNDKHWYKIRAKQQLKNVT